MRNVVPGIIPRSNPRLVLAAVASGDFMLAGQHLRFAFDWDEEKHGRRFWQSAYNKMGWDGKVSDDVIKALNALL